MRFRFSLRAAPLSLSLPLHNQSDQLIQLSYPIDPNNANSDAAAASSSQQPVPMEGETGERLAAVAVHDPKITACKLKSTRLINYGTVSATSSLFVIRRERVKSVRFEKLSNFFLKESQNFYTEDKIKVVNQTFLLECSDALLRTSKLEVEKTGKILETLESAKCYKKKFKNLKSGKFNLLPNFARKTSNLLVYKAD